MNDKRANRQLLPAVWNGAVMLWNELLRGTPPEAVVAPTTKQAAASWSGDLSALEIQRLVAEYELARAPIDPSEKPRETEAPQPSRRLK